MRIDLHTHSTFSDGSDSPTELIEKAASASISTIALTDHDTLEGVSEAKKAAAANGVNLIPGVELSLETDTTGGMHLLVLWLEPGEGPLQARLDELQGGRTGRNDQILARLEELGMPLGNEEVLDEAGAGSVGRPHIAQVMVNRGYVPDIKTAFDLWLGNGKPAYAGRPRLGPEEAVGLARSSGAVPILAHPHTLGLHTSEEMSQLLSRLHDAGLIGLEATYGAYRQHERDGYAHLARRFDLIPTGGSDYHGSYKPGLELGVGYGDLYVDSQVVDELAAHRDSA